MILYKIIFVILQRQTLIINLRRGGNPKQRRKKNDKANEERD